MVAKKHSGNPQIRPLVDTVHYKVFYLLTYLRLHLCDTFYLKVTVNVFLTAVSCECVSRAIYDVFFLEVNRRR